MIAKKQSPLFYLLCCLISHQTIQTNDPSTIHLAQHIIADVTTMTDDIAQLIITCKTEKDPEKIKACVISLTQAIAHMVTMIVEKRKNSKSQSRSSSLSIALQQEEIELLMHMIIKKSEKNMG